MCFIPVVRGIPCGALGWHRTRLYRSVCNAPLGDAVGKYASGISLRALQLP